MSCEYEEILTDIGCEAYTDENGDPIPVPVEIPIGTYCHKKEEYNADCRNCKLWNRRADL